MFIFQQNILLDNINKLEDKEEEDGGLSSKLPLSPDGKYLVLTTPDEEMMEELDREMGELEVKPPSPKVYLFISNSNEKK